MKPVGQPANEAGRTSRRKPSPVTEEQLGLNARAGHG
jgi:hypothetical protein